MTSLTVPFLLPADLLVIPVTELPATSRTKLDAQEGDFAITRPRSRTASSVVDADSADLLERFRSARTIVEAVVDFSKARETDPHTVLTGVLPVLQRLIAARLLLPAEDGLAQPVVASFETEDTFGRFEILRLISVLFDVELYQARDDSGRMCLLKLARAAGGSRIVRSLTREAAVLRRLADLRVPRIIEASERDGLPFLALEWCHGADPAHVSSELRGTDAASRQALLSLCIEIARAYAELHERGIVHGDVHELNVLIDREGDATLVDFGQSYDLADAQTHPRARGGVLQNYDPEMAAALLDGHSGPPATVASEQYGVGTLLYQIVTGQPYLDLAVKREAALRQILTEPPLTFDARKVSPWPELENILRRMLEKDAEARFVSMRDVVSALESIQVREDAPSAPSLSVARATRVARDVFDRLRLDGPLYRSRLPEGPHCSVNNGAAGIAYAWYRLALFREDAETLSIAGAWNRRAQTWMNDHEAFFLDDKTITPDNIGRAGLFHSPTGVHCVRALIACAEGDDAEARRCVESFVAAARVRCSKWDLTLGRAGALLGCALQYEADPAQQPRTGVIGDRMARTLTTRLAAAGSVHTSKIDGIGIAHGWGGGLYALLRWSLATGQPPHAFVSERLDELATLGQHSGRGMSWPRFRDRSDGSLQSTWCNGDAGLVFLWLLAAEVFGEARYRELGEQAGWNVADRGPDRMVDLCCGSSGRAYAFLALYRETGDDIWLRRAQRFAQHAARDIDPDADDAHRLYKGALGVALLVNELENPSRARMPLFEPEGWQWRHRTRA